MTHIYAHVQQNSKGSKPKKQGNHAEKKVTKDIPKPAFNTATQKVNAGVASKPVDKNIK
jgi:methionyl-tRNA synthetase